MPFIRGAPIMPRDVRLTDSKCLNGMGFNTGVLEIIWREVDGELVSLSNNVSILICV